MVKFIFSSMNATAALTLALILCGPMLDAKAEVIVYDNGISTPALGGWASDPSFTLRLADDFQLKPGSNTIGGARWWGGYCCWGISVPDDFSLSIHEFVNGVPADTPLTVASIASLSRTETGNLLQDAIEEFEYVATFDVPITLTANTHYLFSPSNDTSNFGPNWFWSIHAQTSGSDGDTWFSGPNAAWFQNPYEMAFQLLAPEKRIPEPSTLALAIFAIAGLGVSFLRHGSDQRQQQSWPFFSCLHPWGLSGRYGNILQHQPSPLGEEQYESRLDQKRIKVRLAVGKLLKYHGRSLPLGIPSGSAIKASNMRRRTWFASSVAVRPL